MHRGETFGLSIALKLLIGRIYDEHDIMEVEDQSMEGGGAALAAWTETFCSVGGR
jgi:hypothetical protein